jgi:RHS repeat-associated protein
VDEFLMRTDDEGTQGLLSDGLGSTLALTASGEVVTEYTYEPFGATGTTGAGAANRSQYTGRENDGTGLYYYRARFYHPGLQRFISEDPIGFAGGDFNLYAYVGNEPISLSDPLGLDAAKDDCSYAGLRCEGPSRLGGRKDSPVMVGNGFSPETSGLPILLTSGQDPRRGPIINETEAARRGAIEHMLRRVMLRRLEQARALAKPGHSPVIQGGPRTPENVFHALRGNQELLPHNDRTGGGSGWKFNDPELGTVILRNTDHGPRLEVGGVKYQFK